jgi:hypothetical protein
VFEERCVGKANCTLGVMEFIDLLPRACQTNNGKPLAIYTCKYSKLDSVFGPVKRHNLSILVVFTDLLIVISFAIATKLMKSWTKD